MDGCKGGWISIALSHKHGEVHYFSDIASLWEHYRYSASVILIDIPIGLPHQAMPVRECDLLARKDLGFPRSSSVFSPPCRKAVYATSYLEANKINKLTLGKGLSKQAWNITPKIQEVDRLLTHEKPAKAKFLEAHPEVCLKAISRFAMVHNKKKNEGYLERMKVLTSVLPFAQEIMDHALKKFNRAVVSRDDIVDALVLAVTGWLGKEGWGCFPAESIPMDEAGLEMKMVYHNGDTKTVGVMLEVASEGGV